MLLSKSVKVDIIKGNRRTWEKVLNKELCINTTVDIPIELLSMCSHLIIKAKCDECGRETEINYQNYNRCIKFDGKYYCNNSACVVKKRNMVVNLIYGCDNAFQNEDIKQKIIETNNIKYGCDNPQQNKEIKEKTKQTNIKIYGVPYPSQNENIKHKKVETSLENYGVKHPKQSPIVKQTCMDNNMKKYGKLWTTQVPEFVGKGIKTAFKIGVFESIKYQGSYELDFLIFCQKYNLLSYINKSPVVEYINKDGKLSYYHPDYYIKELNLIVEIKSTWTLKLHAENCALKEKAAIEQGYNYIMIINKKYDEFLSIIENLLLNLY